MQLEVLLSCMNQKDWQIAEESKITGNVLIVNQCTDFHDADHQTNSIQTLETMPKRIRMIFACEHGLSRSRNMAIQHAEADICLFCDDDEEFRENYEDTILNAFRNLPEADLIAFQVEGKETRLPNRIQKLGFTSCLKIASYQIAFRRKAILEKQILFDVHMGAGSGNGCGEENKFLLDCRKAGLNIYYVPKTIAALYPKGSTWFFGYDQKFLSERRGHPAYDGPVALRFLWYLLFDSEIQRIRFEHFPFESSQGAISGNSGKSNPLSDY